jgi:F420-dependent oxidoreductase-like protein
MDLRIVTEPQQGATYATLLRIARAAENLGFDGFFRSDHYRHNGDVDGLPGPTDAWITLAGLARETTTIRLGTLVTPATFRLPGPLAIQVAQVDAMSGGRIELGLGAGWYEQEHTAYGIPFPDNRFDRLEEQLEIITGLWNTPVGATYSFSGKHYRLVDSPALPKPVQSPHPPVIVGGRGTKRTPRLAARFADEFNSSFGPVGELQETYRRVHEACEAIGRDPRSLTYSMTVVTCCGRTDAEIARRTDRIRQFTAPSQKVVPGTPQQLVDLLGEYAAIGVQRVYLRTFDLEDFDQLDLIATEILPWARPRAG